MTGEERRNRAVLGGGGRYVRQWLQLKGSQEWKSWLDGFAGHCRLGLADTVEQSLLCYAKERKFRGYRQTLRMRPGYLNGIGTAVAQPRSVGLVSAI